MHGRAHPRSDADTRPHLVAEHHRQDELRPARCTRLSEGEARRHGVNAGVAEAERGALIRFEKGAGGAVEKGGGARRQPRARAPTTVAFPGPCAAILAVRARTSGSAEPPAMAATVSATMDRARSSASPGTSFSPTRARNSQSSCRWSVMVGSRIERTGRSAAPGICRTPSAAAPRLPDSRASAFPAP